MTLRGYLLVGGLAFILGILGSLPARLLLAKPGLILDPSVQLYGLNGSLWNGSADVVQAGKFRLEGLHWSLSPLGLLTAAARLDLTARMGGTEQSAHVVLRPGGRLKASDLRVQLPLSELGPALGLRWLPLTAQLELDLDSLRLKDQTLLAAEGRALLRETRWTLLQPPAPLGDIRAEIGTDDEDRVVAQIENDGGNFSIAGTVSLAQSGEYALDLSLRARPGTDPGAHRALEGFGQPQPDGSRQLKLQGKLAGTAPAPK